MDAIVGYTGFVGSNICKKHTFDKCYNSKNISSAYGTTPDELIYCGIRAEKFIANSRPEDDYSHIQDAINNLEKIKAKSVVLISSIDVLSSVDHSSEKSQIDINKLDAYGRDRFILENWVRNNCKEYTILRLPALFGDGLKKNFLYDIMNPIPKLLKKDLYYNLSEKSSIIKKAYYESEFGFYQLNDNFKNEDLKIAFEKEGFSTLSFTDSRSVFQFYPLERLWDDILIAKKNNLDIVHLATEPMSASELYNKLTGGVFSNEILPEGKLKKYDFITDYSDIFGGNDCYILKKEDVIQRISCFVKGSLS